MPGLPQGATRAAQAAGQAGLPAEERLIATEQAIQLDELITWVWRQAGVEKGAGSEAQQSGLDPKRKD